MKRQKELDTKQDVSVDLLQKKIANLKERIEITLKEEIKKSSRISSIEEANAYSVHSGGKRIRPILTLLIADSLDRNEGALYAACAVELFHTASLIADDLPCMDNDDIRRGKPSLHKAYGEATALLSSYSLIAKGYELIGKNSRLFQEKGNDLALQAIDFLSSSASGKGALDGQLTDLNPKDFSFQTTWRVMYQKTVTFFELSFALGWLFGGGALSQVKKIERGAYHLGYAFQIGDDIADRKEDEKKGALNIALIVGEEKAKELYYREKRSCLEAIKKAGLKNPALFYFLEEILPDR